MGFVHEKHRAKVGKIGGLVFGVVAAWSSVMSWTGLGLFGVDDDSFLWLMTDTTIKLYPIGVSTVDGTHTADGTHVDGISTSSVTDVTRHYVLAGKIEKIDSVTSMGGAEVFLAIGVMSQCVTVEGGAGANAGNSPCSGASGWLAIHSMGDGAAKDGARGAFLVAAQDSLVTGMGSAVPAGAVVAIDSSTGNTTITLKQDAKYTPFAEDDADPECYNGMTRNVILFWCFHAFVVLGAYFTWKRGDVDKDAGNTRMFAFVTCLFGGLLGLYWAFDYNGMFPANYADGDNHCGLTPIPDAVKDITTSTWGLGVWVSGGTAVAMVLWAALHWGLDQGITHGGW